ncbi:uncharacterized protein LOC119738431 [Patiria miniata]|uniref:Uncharacterized protein n=1 Tax=Patiria miniata TaxID=46514 RepID=A0A914AYM3_PATMI|nr:uncharacterized protein LOC119738431 [Patiria miniata]
MKLLQLTLMLGLIGSIVGLQCYLCDDGLIGTSPGCLDPFNTSTTDPTVTKQTCPGGAYSCSKTYLGSTDLTFTVRGCLPTAGCASAGGCASAQYQGNEATICCCTGEFCNGAESVSVNLLTTAAVGLTALVFTL